MYFFVFDATPILICVLQVEFWIDQFHFYRGHNFNTSCSTAFCSSRVQKVREVNDSVCEQFHSFIDGVKFRVQGMSQVPLLVLQIGLP